MLFFYYQLMICDNNYIHVFKIWLMWIKYIIFQIIWFIGIYILMRWEGTILNCVINFIKSFFLINNLTHFSPLFAHFLPLPSFFFVPLYIPTLFSLSPPSFFLLLSFLVLYFLLICTHSTSLISSLLLTFFFVSFSDTPSLSPSSISHL